MVTQGKKQPFMERLFLPLVKHVSYFFWDIADIWAWKNEKMARFYNKHIGIEYKSEYETFGLSKNSKVLHIGCGPYPLTVIELATLLDVNVVGIDAKPKAVQEAREIITRRNMNARITIEQGDGTTYPAQNFDVIIVSSCSYPKVAILEHLFATAKKNAIIIVRELDVATREIYESIQRHPDITIVKKMHHHSLPILLPIAWDALYLKKTS